MWGDVGRYGEIAQHLSCVEVGHCTEGIAQLVLEIGRGCTCGALSTATERRDALAARLKLCVSVTRGRVVGGEALRKLHAIDLLRPFPVDELEHLRQAAPQLRRARQQLERGRVVGRVTLAGGACDDVCEKGGDVGSCGEMQGNLGG